MANEEIHRAVEFLVQQQSQYAARLEKDESRLARLEESFRVLVELARVADERQDILGETMATLSHAMNTLVERSITDEMRRANLEQSMATLSHTMNTLVERSITDEMRRASLEESLQLLVKLAHKHD